MHAPRGKAMEKTNSTKDAGPGCITLFGLPFFAAGMFLSWLYVSGFAKWWDARDWVETPCRIESAELKTSRGSDSTTYQALATYRYVYQGREYRGEKVALGSGSDNIGGFQKAAYREISRHLAQGKPGAEHDPRAPAPRPFRCYVNPSLPSEAVLYRTLRWEMQAFMAIFALTFPAVGAGLVFGGLLGARMKKREERLRANHPAEPWKWKPEWQGPAIPERSNMWKIALHLYTIWAGLIVIPLIAAAALSGAFQQGGPVWLLLIFPAIWGIPLWHSLKRARHRMAIGSARFEPLEIPTSPGCCLRGDIVTDKPLSARSAAELTLSCIRQTTSRSGNKSSTSTETVWSHAETIAHDRITRDPSGFRVPVRIPLPADAPPSGAWKADSAQHFWKLALKVPRTAVHAEFEVPVFRTAESPGTAAAGEPSIIATAASLPSLLAANKITAEFDALGSPLSITCPPSRHLQLTLFLFVFNLFWTAAAIVLVAQQAPLIFRIVWPASSAVIWLIVIQQILHKRHITFSRDALEVVNQFGPVIRSKTIARDRIAGFSHDTNMSSNNTRYYRIRLVDHQGGKLTLADGIAGSIAAETLAARLEAWRIG